MKSCFSSHASPVRLLLISLTLSAVVASGVVQQTQKAAPTAQDSKVETSRGLRTVTFNTPPGLIRIYLPDDTMAGDTISGTVVAEPKGNTAAEREKNRGELRGYVVELEGQKISERPTFKWTPSLPQPNAPVKYQLRVFEVVGSAGRAHESVLDLPLASFPPNPVPTQFQIPALGQAGRTLEIAGPFDGNSVNTGVTVGAQTITPIAESPRKCVIESPANVTGPIQITIREGHVETNGQYRNVGVNLTAPKTRLLKGERTTLNVQVTGLEGIKGPVPITLESQGVISMDGGSFQHFTIQPQQVNNGNFNTTREVTGVQPGAWTATATVVTQPFRICLQDDSVPDRVVVWNTFTGDYIFSCPGCPSSGQTGGFTSPGKGTVTMKGCIITLQHNSPDRRVLANIDQCTSTGTATIESRPTRTKFTITDRNTTDNTCAVH
jgi:hypothetical protein